VNDEKTLMPIEQREVSFYGDELTAIRADDGQVYVAIRQMCDALGLDDRSQRRRIQQHTILAKGYQRGVILTPHRGQQEAGMLRVDLVPLWLSGVSTKAVKDEIRGKLERYQEEAAKVLWEAFQEGRLTADPVFDELLQQDTPEAQAYKLIQGMLHLARSQLMMRAKLEDHETRLERIEATLGDPGKNVTPGQAMQISQAVKAIAMELGKKSGRNEFGGVYGELYRRYEINSYKLLPAHKFDAAMAWLNEWYQALTGEAPF
jgi:hypothetical protein